MFDNITTPLRDATTVDAAERVLGAVAREVGSIAAAQNILLRAAEMAHRNEGIGSFIDLYMEAHDAANFGDPDDVDTDMLHKTVDEIADEFERAAAYRRAAE